MLKQLIVKNFNEYIQDSIINKDSYKMDNEDFRLWLEYLKTHPKKATYEDYKRFKKIYKEENKKINEIILLLYWYKSR